MQKINFGSDEEFIQNYQRLKSSRKMAELYGCTKDPVLQHAKDIGYNVNANKVYKLTPKDKQEILEAYYTDATSAELAKKYDVSRGMITKLWYDAKLSGKKRTNTKNIFESGYKVNALTVIGKSDKRDASGSVLWECKCDCGNTAFISSTRLKSGNVKSCGCLSKQALELGRGRYIDLTDQTFGALTVISRCEDYITSNGDALVQWLCVCDCGNETKVLASNLSSGNTQSCGLCGNNSHGNLKIAQLLQDNNIPFTREKKFSSCKDKGLLPFDFYVNNHYLIEFDGRQHFDQNLTIFNTASTQKHDAIKNEWCKANNIPLIRIPYTHYKNLTIEDLKIETSKFKI